MTMSADDPNPKLHQSESLVLEMVSEGMQKATEEATETYGEELLQALLPQVAIGLSAPLAGVAGVMLAVLTKSIFAQTSGTDRKLDRLLGEPFKNATTTLKNILAESVADEAEEREATRRLTVAADLLDKAQALAEHESSEKRLHIRLYQCLAVALLHGGGAALRRHLKILGAVADASRAQALQETATAERVKVREPWIVSMEMMEIEKYDIHIEGSSPLQRSEAFWEKYLDSVEKDYRKRALAWEQKARDMEKFCELMEVVHKNWRAVLYAPK